MARPKSPDTRIETKVRFLEPTLAKLDLLSLDPLTKKLAYGRRNEILEEALGEYFARYYPIRNQAKESQS